jgi:thiamine biosynthesis lipoprotein
VLTPRPGAGTLSDAASKPVYLAGGEWRMYARRFGIDHALRVDGDGRIEVSRALRDRLQFEQGLSATVVD